ncbi:piercer of microtubule wall 2 protein [Pseudophryne corroboree]|uniref:piercer of microtubule wall 2 protein n=1 Tax=Pseudophryne corroboree TaxID=495146 RepID=UPI00308200EC
MSASNRSSTDIGTEKKPTAPTCTNLGNPVFSCTMNPRPATSSIFQAKQENILFRTTASEYGALRPSYETAPCYHYPMSQMFSEHLATCGMYRNHSLNTVVDKNRVCDCINLHNTL